MELQFIKERLTIIKRLKGLTIVEIDNKMKALSNRKASYNIDTWEVRESKHTTERVQLLADAIEMPIEYFYFPQIEINIDIAMGVTIIILGTTKRVYFDFFTGLNHKLESFNLD